MRHPKLLFNFLDLILHLYYVHQLILKLLRLIQNISFQTFHTLQVLKENSPKIQINFAFFILVTKQTVDNDLMLFIYTLTYDHTHALIIDNFLTVHSDNYLNFQVRYVQLIGH